MSPTMEDREAENTDLTVNEPKHMPVSEAPEVSTPVTAASTDSRPRIDDGIERSLDPRAVALNRTVAWITTAVLSLASVIGVTLVILLSPLPAWAKILLALLWTGGASASAWFAQRWPEIEHRHAFYRVDGIGIQIRKGVYWRREIHVPKSRVQHTDVSQGPLERSHGLGTLVIYTAGSEFARVELSGLDHDVALRIRDHLLPLESDDAV